MIYVLIYLVSIPVPLYYGYLAVKDIFDTKFYRPEGRFPRPARRSDVLDTALGWGFVSLIPIFNSVFTLCCLAGFLQTRVTESKILKWLREPL